MQSTAPLRLRALLRESQRRDSLASQETERVAAVHPTQITQPLRLRSTHLLVNSRTKTIDLVASNVARFRAIHGYLPSLILLSACRYLEMVNQGKRDYQGIPFGFERWGDGYEILLRGKE